MFSKNFHVKTLKKQFEITLKTFVTLPRKIILPVATRKFFQLQCLAVRRRITSFWG